MDRATDAYWGGESTCMYGTRLCHSEGLWDICGPVRSLQIHKWSACFVYSMFHVFLLSLGVATINILSIVLLLCINSDVKMVLKDHHTFFFKTNLHSILLQSLVDCIPPCTSACWIASHSDWDYKADLVQVTSVRCTDSVMMLVCPTVSAIQVPRCLPSRYKSWNFCLGNLHSLAGH